MNRFQEMLFNLTTQNTHGTEPRPQQVLVVAARLRERNVNLCQCFLELWNACADLEPCCASSFGLDGNGQVNLLPGNPLCGAEDEMVLAAGDDLTWAFATRLAQVPIFDLSRPEQSDPLVVA